MLLSTKDSRFDIFRGDSLPLIRGIQYVNKIMTCTTLLLLLLLLQLLLLLLMIIIIITIIIIIIRRRRRRRRTKISTITLVRILPTWFASELKAVVV